MGIPAGRSGPGYPLIRLQALSAAPALRPSKWPVSVSIPNAEEVLIYHVELPVLNLKIKLILFLKRAKYIKFSLAIIFSNLAKLKFYKVLMHNKLNNLTADDFAVVDLFCGVGGLTHGFVNEGFHVTAGIDFDKSCEYAFATNNNSKFLHKDIANMTSADLSALYPKDKKKILVGCAPCQPFSRINKKDASLDNKWKLLYAFGKLAHEVRPEIISMENVPQLAKFNGGKVLNDFIETLQKLGYLVKTHIVEAANYGVPQKRRRLILLASLLGPIELIKPTHDSNNYITVKDAIHHLPKIADGEILQNDTLHRSRKLNDISKERIIATPIGGTWRDWPENLILPCHKKETGKEFGSVYGRMIWDKPAPTLTTYCTGLSNGRYGHPEQQRAISAREAAILQSFPESYQFIDPKTPFSMANVSRHIGNAVPVKLGSAIARSIANHLKTL